MNDNKEKSNDGKLIVGGIVLIIALFIGIKLVFWGLGQAIPQTPADVSQGVSASQSVPGDGSGDPDAPSYCIHCGRALPDSFRWGQFCPYCGEKVA